ncbi:(d)CMP kinase [Desulfobaculum bizertense]|uniref:(d)CMP kinase n=1 Tax=Desulfobaculum bizertense TaxID=376490 RepID=UPI001F2524A2|nr:(d)CMP kinase [Desulfobaculum bizertense]UIJ37223.1 (d)CMP kinase [Desulfobaculum bizertense]
MAKPVIVTLDGPAGVGKTTLAQRVAKELGIAYLDTGAMFRTTALELGHDADKLPEGEMSERLNTLHFSLSQEEGESVLRVNKRRIGNEIRTEEVGMMASRVAVLPTVRTFLRRSQQRLGSEVSLLAEGRDMGTTVFPKATCKIFLDASAEVRAKRRFLQLQEMGHDANLEKLAQQIRERDELDRNRKVAPLRPAKDAVVVDSSEMGIDEVFQAILAAVHAAVESE